MMSARVAPVTALMNFCVLLGHDVSESGASDGSHELLRSPSPLLGSLFNHALAVLATVQYRPVDLSGVTLEGMIPLAFRVEEDLRFAIGARDAFSVSRVDFQPGKSANLDLQ